MAPTSTTNYGRNVSNDLDAFPRHGSVCSCPDLIPLHLISIEAKGDEKLFWVTGYYLSTGTLLSLTLHLWCEEVKRNSRKWMIQNNHACITHC